MLTDLHEIAETFDRMIGCAPHKGLLSDGFHVEFSAEYQAYWHSHYYKTERGKAARKRHYDKTADVRTRQARESYERSKLDPVREAKRKARAKRAKAAWRVRQKVDAIELLGADPVPRSGRPNELARARAAQNSARAKVASVVVRLRRDIELSDLFPRTALLRMLREILEVDPTIGDRALSASQVETWRSCNRKWGLLYLDKEPKTPDWSAQVGTVVHFLAEQWLKFGRYPDVASALILPDHRGALPAGWERHSDKDKAFDGWIVDRAGHERQQFWTYHPGQILQAGIKLIPKPGQVTVEGRFSFITNVLGIPIKWAGAKDMEWFDRIPHVGDHKTTKNWRYQKTDTTLLTDVQGNLYAWEAMERHDVDVVGLDWITYLTRGKADARAARIETKRAHVREQVAEIESSAHQILVTRSLHKRGLLKSADLGVNLESCPAYGGCQFRDTPKCRIRLKDIGKMSTDFATFINQNFPGSAGAVPPPPPVVAPPPVTAAFAQAVPNPIDRGLILAGLDKVVSGQAARPDYWIPTDPLNKTQEYLKGAGAPLSVIAGAAAPEMNPPPQHVAAAYDAGGFVLDGGVINPPEAPPVAPASPEQMPPAPIAAVPPPPVSAPSPFVAPAPVPAPGAIHPTGAVATSSLSGDTVSDGLELLDRAARKALAMQRGLVDKTCKLGPDKLLEILRSGVGVVEPAQVVTAPPAAAIESTPTVTFSKPVELEQPIPWTNGVPVMYHPSTAIESTTTPPNISLGTAVDHSLPSSTPWAGAPVPNPSALIVPPPVVSAPVLSPPVVAAPAAPAQTNPSNYPDASTYLAVDLAVSSVPTGTSGIGVLFINSLPDGPHSTLSDLLTEVMPGVLKAAQDAEGPHVTHYRFVGFGKGPALLAKHVAEHLRAGRYNALVVDARTPEGLDLITTLQGAAEHTIRGF